MLYCLFKCSWKKNDYKKGSITFYIKNVYLNMQFFKNSSRLIDLLNKRYIIK